MATHDTPEAAVAAALADCDVIEGYSWDSQVPPGWRHVKLAAAILAAMPDWTLVPRVATADWTGSTRKDAEIARLRAALKAGVEIVTAVTEWGGNCGGLPQTLQDRADWWRLDVDPVLEARP